MTTAVAGAPERRAAPALLALRRVPAAVVWSVVALGAFALHLQGRQRGLLYPDGYDYLLIARGIAEHLTPGLALGHGGELWVPSVDASLKPLFPALVALISAAAPIRAGADLLTAAAAAATVVLAGVLAGRLTGSRRAAALSAAATLASPALAYWSGFAGPDPLAEALALATALALVERRALLAGVLGGLCAATRPEWFVVVAAAGLTGLLCSSTREPARRALTSGAFTLAIIVAVLRPPLALPSGGPLLLLAAIAGAVLCNVAAVWASGTRRRATIAAASALAALAVVALSGRVPALGALVRGGDWPLLLLGSAGILRACASGRGRPALLILATVLLLGAIYVYRNAGLERYLAQLIPAVCVAAGFLVAPGPRSRAQGTAETGARRWDPPIAWVAAATVATALVVAAISPRPQLAGDTFASLAGRLAAAPPGTLLSAAPDAYGFLLPGRTERTLRPGERGLILLDAAQRAYAPGLGAAGVILARFSAPDGFERPDGTLDTGPATLVRGIVTATPGVSAAGGGGRDSTNG
jgi:hypothetical protein